MLFTGFLDTENSFGDELDYREAMNGADQPTTDRAFFALGTWDQSASSFQFQNGYQDNELQPFAQDQPHNNENQYPPTDHALQAGADTVYMTPPSTPPHGGVNTQQFYDIEAGTLLGTQIGAQHDVVNDGAVTPPSMASEDGDAVHHDEAMPFPGWANLTPGILTPETSTRSSPDNQPDELDFDDIEDETKAYARSEAESAPPSPAAESPVCDAMSAADMEEGEDASNDEEAERGTSCITCGKDFVGLNIFAIIVHLDVHSDDWKITENGNDTHLCPYEHCRFAQGLRFKGSAARVRQHVARQHINAAPMCPGKCGVFARKDSLDRHRKNTCTRCEGCQTECNSLASRVKHERSCNHALLARKGRSEQEI